MIIIKMTSLSLMLAYLIAGSAGGDKATPGPTFSAELVTSAAGASPVRRTGQVYVSNGRVRIETSAISDGFFIVDGGQPGAWFVRPRQQIFMDARQSSPLTQLLVPVDPEDACRQWQIMEQVASASDQSSEWQCERLGTDLIAGQETVKYRTTSGQRHHSERWIDPIRAFPIRMETADGAMIALEKIVDAPQPSSLFTIPSAYRKFDPLQLIEQIKQSDVWVEPLR